MSLWTRRGTPARISVDRRLSLLVLSEACAAVVVIVTALVALSRLGSERAYMDRYVFAPLVDIGEALVAVDELHAQVARPPGDPVSRARGPILRLQAFLDRYQRDWETGTSSMAEAARLRVELERQGQTRLLEQEHEQVGDAQGALRALERTAGLLDVEAGNPPVRIGDVVLLDRSLGRLNLINLHYVQIAYAAFERAHRWVTTFFVIVSLVGLLAATLMGLYVRGAVGPRVRRMLEAVARFRDGERTGPIEDVGDDDLGMLAHALSMSFKAIAERDRERARFLAVAAHELKTPLTTLKGFSQSALRHLDDHERTGRALSVVDRQATRLSRLVQDLLWSARASVGQLPFHPGPVDLDVLARKVIGEIELAYPGRAFDLDSSEQESLLGDATLLEHATWNLLVQAVTLAPDAARVHVSLEPAPATIRLSIAAHYTLRLPDDLSELIEPFDALPVERPGAGPRSTGLGLHMVREIARLHRATFYLERRAGDVLVSVLELRR